MEAVSVSCWRVGCSKRPTYGVAGSKIREFCAQHAEPEMVNVDHKRCVTHSQCSSGREKEGGGGAYSFCWPQSFYHCLRIPLETEHRGTAEEGVGGEIGRWRTEGGGRCGERKMPQEVAPIESTECWLWRESP